MSLLVATQSAIFYLAACMPCRQARHHQKAHTKAKAEREEKERLRAEHPNTYRQPDPFNTNPYWSEEIMMGPHIEKKEWKSRKNASDRGLNSAGNDKASTVGSTVVVETSNPESSPTVIGEDGTTLSMTTSISEDWNKKRYQREDEELWGHEFSRAGHRLIDAIKQAGSSAHRRIEASLGMEPKPVTDEERQSFYFAPKHPPVNDYHPPIVRQRPAHKDAHKWMLQPPPAAKIMEGKVPVSRTGSMASHVSRRTAASDSPALGRLMHERAMEAKIRSGELPRPDSRKKNTAASTSRQSWQSARSGSPSVVSSDVSEGRTRRKSRRRARPSMVSESSSSEDDEVFYKLKSSDSNASRSTKAARKPKLSTIASSHGSEKGSAPETAQTTPSDSKTPRSTAPPLDIADVLPLPPPALKVNTNIPATSTSTRTIEEVLPAKQSVPLTANRQSQIAI